MYRIFKELRNIQNVRVALEQELHKVRSVRIDLEKELHNAQRLVSIRKPLSVYGRPVPASDNSEIVIPWFDPAEFVGVLQKTINIFRNRMTFSVSGKDGVIYFTPNVIYNSFKELADEKDAPEALLYESGEDRARLLIFITDKMREYGAIVENSIRPGYFSAQYNVMSRGSEGKIGFAPYFADVFPGINLATLEKEKGTNIKAIEIGEPVSIRAAA